MIELHRLLIGDATRNDAFIAALKQVIEPGKTTIADIGSGTGFLSFVAEKLGAKQCHLYEHSRDVLKLSEQLGRENGMKRCVFNNVHSTSVQKPPAVDVVISETLGNWAFEENIIETMNDAQRFLKPNGIVIPQELRSFVAPVTASRLYDELNVWERGGNGLDFTTAREVCMNNMYVKEILPSDLPSPVLSVAKDGRAWSASGGPGEGMKENMWDVVDFTKKNSSIREKSLQWTFDSDITMYGYACWWDITLVGNITLSTSPLGPPTHWKQIFLPLVDPLMIKKGQIVTLSLKSDSRYEVKINVEWETTLKDGKGKVLSSTKQDMRKGYLQ